MTLETLLLIAGLLHFVLLPVSLSVPRVMRWKEELSGLSPLNRQIIWVHGAFIVGLIVAFGVITIVARHAMAFGEGQGPILAALMGLFWLGRLAVQLCYYNQKDWPKGRWVVLGRYALTVLFTFWSVVYLMAFIYFLGSRG